MATVLFSYLRWIALSPTRSLQIFHSAKNRTKFHLLSTVHSSVYWMELFPFQNQEHAAGIVIVSGCVCPYLCQSLCNFNVLCSKFLPYESKLKKNLTCYFTKQMWWNGMRHFFTIIECKWGTFQFILFFITFGMKEEIFLNAEFISGTKKFKFWIVAIYRNINNTISPHVSLLSFLCFEYPFHPKPECYMLNVISYVWRLKISSMLWTTMFSCISCNVLWKIGNNSYIFNLITQ